MSTTVTNFTGVDFNEAFAEDALLLSALNELVRSWKAGEIKMRVDPTFFRPDNREHLLSAIELKRLKLTRGDIGQCDIARVNNIVVPAAIRDSVVARLETFFIDHKVSAFSGSMWYRPGGFMSWHTNSGGRGRRMYMTYVDEGGKSGFRYEDQVTGEVKTSLDVPGWQFRIFNIGAQKFWHCVTSDVDRLSLGVRLLTPEDEIDHV